MAPTMYSVQCETNVKEQRI